MRQVEHDERLTLRLTQALVSDVKYYANKSCLTPSQFIRDAIEVHVRRQLIAQAFPFYATKHTPYDGFDASVKRKLQDEGVID